MTTAPIATNGEKTLVISNLQKSYGGRRVVDDVSFHVSRGEVVGLLGRNGAGKTTSFDMVLGLVIPEKGSVTLGARRGSRRSPAPRCSARWRP